MTRWHSYHNIPRRYEAQGFTGIQDLELDVGMQPHSNPQIFKHAETEILHETGTPAMVLKSPPMSLANRPREGNRA